MKNFLKKKSATIMLLTLLSVSCSTFANYTLLPLLQRHLRLSLDGPWTEFRQKESICIKRVLGLCVKSEVKEVIYRDFDFTKYEDRKKFNDMDFDCSVRSRPE